MQLAPNTVIAQRFRLNRQLGRGGMGSVWHATHLGLDIPCAVKFIEGEYAQLPEAQARFEREAKAAAQLRSPHVVQILDHGVCDGVPYIAMELLDGEDLGKRIARVGRMNPNEIVTVVTQVCRALTKAHSVGIVHRDLKPDNIFLVKDDDREIAKVLDFGIAKANSNTLEGSNTKTGAMLGTPYYMSPEQAQGTKSVDSRADLWSLAVIVFQAVTGRLPFESEALGDLLVKIIVSPIPVPSQVAPDVPAAFDKWWGKAASRDPNQRFQTAKEFGDSLNLVFGVSQMTDVMDRGQVRAAMQEGVGGGTLAVPMVTPPGYSNVAPHAMTPMPNTAPLGHTQNTPQPGQPGRPPMPSQHTPHPGGPQEGWPQTPQPMAHTFGGGAVDVSKKKTGLFIAIGAGGLLAFIGIIVIVAVLLRKPSGSGAAAAGTTTPTATATETSTAAATATTTAAPTDTAPPADTTAKPETTATPTATATATTTSTATAVATNTVKPPAFPTAPATVKPPTTATAKPPATGTAKPPRDLGF